MAWTKTKIIVTVGIGVVLVAGITTLVLCRHQIHEQLNLHRGHKAIARHLADPVDMTASYTTPASYFDQITQFPAWTTVPRGFHVFRNVPLQIDGMICLWGEGNAKQGITFPKERLGIQMNQKFETLYVYHGSFYQSPPGTPVCEVVLRYEDGSSATNQLRYGNDILDWVAGNRADAKATPTSPNSKLAWLGGSFRPDRKNDKRLLRFCLTAIKNEYPSLRVLSVDLYSCNSLTAACILAMTGGKASLMK